MTERTAAQAPRDPAETRQLIARVMYMIVFGFAFWVCSIVLGLAAILQLLMVAFTRERNDNLTVLGQGLGDYLRQIVRYLTFVAEEPPFPFAEWPQQHRAGTNEPT
ncbi:MAG TPA: DUF4389 domain-containing protein [Steroidobacteraceae bacterium]|nr:DUF4389 domain-containing protein [Steroidobacteraceae bacterium]